MKNCLLILLSILIGYYPLSGDRLFPLKHPLTLETQPIEGPHPLARKSGFASFHQTANPKAGLPEIARQTQWGLPRGTPAIRQLKVLALRIEFQADCEDASTGNGLFDLRDTTQFLYEEGHEFDRTPHNRHYFEKHLDALDRYYRAVSDGRLELSYQVYPKIENQAYRLAWTMQRYGQNGPYSSWNESLAQFVYDAVLMADSTDPELDFSQWDVVILFHAGSDWQSDMAGLGNSPDDLPSANIFLGTPVPVDNGANHVASVMLIPETTSQDGRIGVINGVLAHEFGHQLGFVDIYSTVDFRPVVGNFSLMDAGNLLTAQLGDMFVHGLLPCYPDPFHRAFAGFNDVITLNQPAENVTVNACEIYQSPGKIYRIPITANEYFLVENRQQNPSERDIAIWLKDGVIAGPVDLDKNFLPVYDYLLPGSGMLIWHVDESVAELDYITEDEIPNNWQANTLQLDPAHPFLSVEEADGSHDIGIFINELGTEFDFFSADNNPHFGPSTQPNSNSYSGISSGLHVMNISASGPAMNFTLSWEKWFPTSTLNLGVSAPLRALFPFPQSADTLNDFLALDQAGNLYGIHQLARGILQTYHQWDPTQYPDSQGFLFAISCQELPLMGKLSDPRQDQLIYYRSGEVVAYNMNSESDRTCNLFRMTGKPDSSPRMSKTSALETDDTFNQGPGILVKLNPEDSLNSLFFSPGNDEIWLVNLDTAIVWNTGWGKITGLTYSPQREWGLVALTEYGRVLLLDPLGDGEIRNWPLAGQCLPQGQPILADFNGDQREELIALDQCGALHTLDDQGYYCDGFPVQLDNGPITTHPVLGNIDDDPTPELIVATNQALYAINYNGTLVSNFPFTAKRTEPYDQAVASPVLADMEETGKQSILWATPDHRLWVIDGNGDFHNELSLSIEGTITESPQWLKLVSTPAGSGDFALTTVTNMGTVAVYPSELTADRIGWPMAGYNFEHIFQNPDGIPIDTAAIPSEKVFELSTAHNFPNPVNGSMTSIYYYLYQPAEINITIYDVSGKKMIGPLAGSSYPMTENIVPIDVSSLESDLYLGLLKAVWEGKEFKTWFKMAVIK